MTLPLRFLMKMTTTNKVRGSHKIVPLSGTRAPCSSEQWQSGRERMWSHESSGTF
jgi:hypothetical protein